MNHRRLSFLVFLAALFAVGADWMQFRGPGGSGVSDEKGLPDSWSSKENIVWRTDLPGPGTSSPIVVGKRIYLTCYTGYGLKEGKDGMDKLMRHLVCIDRAKGDILWTKDFKPELPESNYVGGNNTQHGYSSSTVASDGKHLYLFFGKSGVYCLDLDGKEKWHASVGTGTNGWGSSNSPMLYKDLVIINASIESGCLVGLNKNTGDEVWRTKGIRSSWNTPVLVDVPGKPPELVLSESSAVIGFDPEKGTELWRVTGFGGYVCPSVVTDSPLLSEGQPKREGDAVVYVVRGEALAIKAGGRGDVTKSHVLWRFKGSSLVPSPVYHDGRLYWAGGTAICLNATTGEEIHRGRIEGGTYYASPLVADGKIYYVSRFAGTAVTEAGPKFKLLSRNKFEDDGSRTNASPIAHEGCILLRTDRYLYCIGKRQ